MNYSGPILFNLFIYLGSLPEVVLRRRILAGLRRAQGLEGLLDGFLDFDDGLRKGLPINLPKLLTLPTFLLSLLPVICIHPRYL